MLRMELSKRSMMQFMATNFEVPFFTIQRIGGVIVEAADGVDNRRRAAHRSGESDRVAAGNLCPSFMQAALVEEHDLELLEVVFFNITSVGCAASRQEHKN